MAKRLVVVLAAVVSLLVAGGSAVLAVPLPFPPCVPGWGC